jgi:MFS family permease
LIAGRFFLSFFATCAHTAAPLYLVEITPAAYRGTLAGLYNTFYNVVSMPTVDGKLYRSTNTD